MIRIKTIQMTTNSTEKDVSIDCLMDIMNESIFLFEPQRKSARVCSAVMAANSIYWQLAKQKNDYY